MASRCVDARRYGDSRDHLTWKVSERGLEGGVGVGVGGTGGSTHTYHVLGRGCFFSHHLLLFYKTEKKKISCESNKRFGLCD